MDLITGTETAIRMNKLAQSEVEQSRMKVSILFSSAKIPTSNLTIQEKNANPSLSIDQRIILLAGKEKCTILLYNWLRVE